MASSISSLRAALRDQQNGKDLTRNAGEGIWAFYVRATMAPAKQPECHNSEEFERQHKGVVAELEAIEPLTPAEKNSLRSAKCVVKKCVDAGQPASVWRIGGDGTFERNEDGELMPKGKSELQTPRSDLDSIKKAIEGIRSKLTKEDSELLGDEIREIATLLQGLTAQAYEHGALVAGVDVSTFMAG